jgi:shikimate kinase
MGQPFEPQSAANQQTYLDLETQMLRQTMDRLANPPLNGNIVVDTTGSVVHTDEAIRNELAIHSTIVYLEATPDMRQKMFEMYIAEPKPVIWGDVFTQKDGETTNQALARSYPELLARRSVIYKQMAHVAVSREVSLAIATTDEFLEYVRDGLPTAYANSANYTPRK